MVTSYTFVKMLITSLFSSTESHLFSFLTKILLPFCASSQAPSLETMAALRVSQAANKERQPLSCPSEAKASHTPPGG